MAFCLFLAGCGPAPGPPHPIALKPLPRLHLPAALIHRLHRDYVILRRANAVTGRFIHHALGLHLTQHRRRLTPMASMHLPASVDLSVGAPPPGDQGQISSCTAWSSGYGLASWWGHKQGLMAGQFDPMSTYNRVAHGQNISLDPADVLNDEQTVGLTPLTSTLLTVDSKPATARWTGYSLIYDSSQSTDLTPISQTLAMGKPVLLGIDVTPTFEAATAQAPYVDVTPTDTSLGSHAVAVYKMDATGVWIENSWSAKWGLSGWAELSWSYLRQHLEVAYTVDGLTSLAHTDSRRGLPSLGGSGMRPLPFRFAVV